MDDSENTLLLKVADPPAERLEGHPQGLQLVPLPDTNKDREVRTCCRCRRKRSLSEFYRKGDRFESRCKDCVLKTKACAYRKKRMKKSAKQKEETEAVWDEVIETTLTDMSGSVRLEALLRDFMLDVILDAS